MSDYDDAFFARRGVDLGRINPATTPVDEYDRETEALRAKIATGNYEGILGQARLSRDTNQLLGREQGGPNRRVARSDGTIVGKAFTRNSGSVFRGLGGAASAFGAEDTGDRLSGLGTRLL